MKDIIHFSHANGFPASTYQRIFAELADDYELRYIERIGHDPHFPVTRGWPCLVEQLLNDIGRAYQRPVWLVGHSLGGYLSLMAALKQPHWVRGVIMLDSPLLSGWRSGVLRATQWAGFDDHLSAAAATRNRRIHWTSRDEAWRHFHAKAAFARWDQRMLSDYIDYGIPQISEDGGRRLAFDRQVEYRIYKTLPFTLGVQPTHGLPVGFLGGTRSREVRHIGLAATRRVTQERIEWLDGSHLFPMEKPLETVRALRRMMRILRSDG